MFRIRVRRQVTSEILVCDFAQRNLKTAIERGIDVAFSIQNSKYENPTGIDLRPRGFTLLELLIVLVILVIAGSLAIPFARRAFTSQHVAKAADLVRSELNEARIQAMQTGDVYGFFYFPETANYKIAPFNDEMNNILQDGGRRREIIRSSNFDYGDGLLPNGVLFAKGETAEDARSEAEFEANSVSTEIRPVLFYPDGTSQTARLLLKSQDDDYVEIKLRGMTGTSKSGAVFDNIPRSNR